MSTAIRPEPSRQEESSCARLPICDLLYCGVSLVLHLVTVGVVLMMAYRLHWLGFAALAWTAFACAAAASLVIAAISVFWYLRDRNDTFRLSDLGLHLSLHMLQLALVWRHCLMFRRLKPSCVKLLFCELCILRAVHSALLAVPCLFLFAFVLLRHDQPELRAWTLIGWSMTLADLCWSLASVGRRTSRSQPDGFLLTWPGVLSQWLWRLGEVGARIWSLSVYLASFPQFFVVVIALHWSLIFLGFLLVFPPVPSVVSQPRTASDKAKSCLRILLLAGVHTLCFFNTQKGDQLQLRCVVYYCVTLAENSLLVGLWLIVGHESSEWQRILVCSFTWAGYVFGVSMLVVYYKFMHINVLRAKFQSAASACDHHSVSRIETSSSFACNLKWKRNDLGGNVRPNYDLKSPTTLNNSRQQRNKHSSLSGANKTKISTVTQVRKEFANVVPDENILESRF